MLAHIYDCEEFNPTLSSAFPYRNKRMFDEC